MTISSFLLTFVRQWGGSMNTQELKIKDVSGNGAETFVTIPAPIVHWLREHDLRDLKGLLLEMHSAGEDITEYSQVLEDVW
jgi:hypothetical protein